MSADPVGVAVRQLYARLLGAWNQRDATAMAACFAPDATMIGYDGSVATGEQIEAHLAPIFADHPTARYVAKVREVRALGPEVALLRAIVGMIPPGSEELNPAVNAHQTVIATAREQSWRIELFQNTPAQYHGRPHLVAEHTAELRDMIEGARSGQ